MPPGFRFVLKASRRITHIKRLREVADEPAYLYRVPTSLGPHMGVVLFQMPPNFKLDLPRLEAFLDQIPAGRGAAFEFRHTSLFVPEVYEALRRRRCALVLSDDEAVRITYVLESDDAPCRQVEGQRAMDAVESDVG